MDGNVLANKTAADRNAVDFYATPADVTYALLAFLENCGALRKSDVIWEPACGTGKMHEAFLAKGFNQIVASDANDYGGNKIIDFLNPTEIPFFQWIITNPPFTHAAQFIEKAHGLQRPFAMLLKSQYGHAAKRTELFERTKPAFVLPLTWRPDFLFGAKSGSPTMEVLWTVWLWAENGPTTYEPLKRGEM